MLTRAISIYLVVLSLGFVEEAWGRTDAMRKPCVDCHTMHNSQNNAPVVAATALFGDNLSQQGLLNNTCYGCHTGQNVAGSMPFVFDNQGVPQYGSTGTESSSRDTLAGGNFYWASPAAAGFSERTGHNVEVITSQVARSPQGSFGLLSFDSTTPLSCAGTYGCHGDPSFADPLRSLKGAHHSKESLPDDGSTVGQSYRYLNGIIGIEDSDWELTVSSADHNQYSGIDRYNANDGNPPPPSAISSFCARCHGDFHNDTRVGSDGISAGLMGVDTWLRHPVDYDMNNNATGGTEYDGYGGAGTYVVETPLATDDLTGGMLANVTSPGDAIITCLTCHRAHGTPFDSILRWDYKNWPDSSVLPSPYNGCGDCHTFRN